MRREPPCPDLLLLKKAHSEFLCDVARNVSGGGKHAPSAIADVASYVSTSFDTVSYMTEKILAILFLFIKSVIAATGYAGLTLLMAIESACIPLPSELIMPFAGYLVYEGTMKLLWGATAGAIGCNLGSLVAYEIGYHGGRPLVEKYGRWILMGRRELDWADRFFHSRGELAVVIARMLPVIRTFIALPAGVARMPRGKFHVYTFIGSW